MCFVKPGAFLVSEQHARICQPIPTNLFVQQVIFQCTVSTNQPLQTTASNVRTLARQFSLQCHCGLNVDQQNGARKAQHKVQHSTSERWCTSVSFQCSQDVLQNILASFQRPSGHSIIETNPHTDTHTARHTHERYSDCRWRVCGWLWWLFYDFLIAHGLLWFCAERRALSVVDAIIVCVYVWLCCRRNQLETSRLRGAGCRVGELTRRSYNGNDLTTKNINHSVAHGLLQHQPQHFDHDLPTHFLPKKSKEHRPGTFCCEEE